MEDVPCPSVYVERLGFELDKNYNETKLQVLLSPAVLIAKDNIEVGILADINKMGLNCTEYVFEPQF